MRLVLTAATALTLFLLPLQEFRLQSHDRSLPIWSLVVGAVVVLWIVGLLRGAIRFPNWSSYHWPTLLFALIAAAEVFLTRDVARVWTYWHFNAEPIFIALLVWTLSAGDARARQVIKVSFGAMAIGLGLLEIVYLVGLTVYRIGVGFSWIPENAALLLPPILAFFFTKLFVVSARERMRGEQLVLIGTCLLGAVAVVSAAVHTNVAWWIPTRELIGSPLVLPLVWLIAVFASRSVRRLRNGSDPHHRAAVIGFIAAMGALLLQCVATGAVFAGQAVLFWVLLALAEGSDSSPRPSGSATEKK